MDDEPAPIPPPRGAPEGVPDPPTAAELAEEAGRYERMKERYEAARVRVDDTVERIESRRSDSLAIETVMSSWERDNAAGGDVLAGAMAFRVFMFLIPYVFVLVVGLGFAGDAADISSQDAAAKAGIGGLAALAIVHADSASNASRWTVLVIGGFALFLGSRSAIKVLVAIYSLIWGVPIQKVQRLSRAGALLVGIITLALAIVALIGQIRDDSEPLGLLLMLLYTAVPFGTWLYVSDRLPKAEGAGWRDLAPGAALVAVGVQGLHFFTVLWLAHSMDHKTETYGAIGAALALLLWAFVLGRILTLSAVINAAIWGRKHPAALSPEQTAD